MAQFSARDGLEHEYLALWASTIGRRIRGRVIANSMGPRPRRGRVIWASMNGDSMLMGDGTELLRGVTGSTRNIF